MSQKTEKIFSGDYSRGMWDEINNATTIDELKNALYLIGCRLQEFENKVFPITDDDIFSEIKDIQERISKLSERISNDDYPNKEREYYKLLALQRTKNAYNKLDRVTLYLRASQNPRR